MEIEDVDIDGVRLKKGGFIFLWFHDSLALTKAWNAWKSEDEDEYHFLFSFVGTRDNNPFPVFETTILSFRENTITSDYLSMAKDHMYGLDNCVIIAVSPLGKMSDSKFRGY